MPIFPAQDGDCARLDFRAPGLPVDGLSFSSFEHIIRADTIDEVIPAIHELSNLCAAGYYAAGYLAYEAAGAFDAALRTPRQSGEFPLLLFGLSRSAAAAEALRTGGTYSWGEWRARWDSERYHAAFTRVKQALYDGETYQVNLTFPLETEFAGDALAAYLDLCRAQRGDYSGFLRIGDWQMLSLSPELFFFRRGGEIFAKPMKGTAARGRTLAEDILAREALLGSEKERAENLMIVDLLRNDIGRICRGGSVETPRLLVPERYPTLWQMTSEVRGVLEDGVGLCEILRALFPCGSVTGAPKVRTMELIAELEAGERSVYCGAFGVVLPGGDCVFNVPIRTARIKDGRAHYHVGGGIVSDAQGEKEYDECLLKARVLTAPHAEFSLLETILWQPESGFYLLPRHLERLRQSAQYFGFAYDEAEILRALNAAVCGAVGARRLRLLLPREGGAQVEAAPFTPHDGSTVRVRLAAEPVDSREVFLFHKTTNRAIYERFRQNLAGAFDVILHNERGELTESTIANIALAIDGVWYTPPVECGLLAGVMRAELLAREELQERVLTRADLDRAHGLRLLNSLRGIMPAELILPDI